MLGMNLALVGQGTVPIWVFFVSIMAFSLMTYLPVYFLPISPWKRKLYLITYRLAKWSFPAAF